MQLDNQAVHRLLNQLFLALPYLIVGLAILLFIFSIVLYFTKKGQPTNSTAKLGLKVFFANGWTIAMLAVVVGIYVLAKLPEGQGLLSLNAVVTEGIHRTSDATSASNETPAGTTMQTSGDEQATIEPDDSPANDDLTDAPATSSSVEATPGPSAPPTTAPTDSTKTPKPVKQTAKPTAKSTPTPKPTPKPTVKPTSKPTTVPTTPTPTVKPTATPVPNTSVTGVSLDQTSRSLTTGQNFTLTATILPSNATNKSVSWSSSNGTVATVSGSGASITVTAKAPGTAVITVKTADGNLSDSCTVTVSEPVIHVTGVSLSVSSNAVLPGGSFTLTATVSPSNATNSNLTWSSNNPGVVWTSSSSGNSVTVSTINNDTGSATITVTSVDGGHTDTCRVTIKLHAPNNVRIYSTASDMLQFTWNTVGGLACSYNVYFNNVYKGNCKDPGGLCVRGLSPNTEYWCKVYAVDKFGQEGFQSEPVAARTSS